MDRFDGEAPLTETTIATLRTRARELFGFDSLRREQERAIMHLVAGDDTLVVLPTGAGKSAVYELAAQFVAGPTVVVSPLRALERDQVDKISEHDLGGAVFVNSSLTARGRAEALAGFRNADVRFLYVAPEQLENESVFEAVAAAEPAMFVVDEAHCITTWGHDFRPAYLHLGDSIQALGHPVVCASTATAPHHVRAEIIHRLAMREPAVIIAGFDRPNLDLGVEAFSDPEDKTDALVERVRRARLPGIVYVATRGHVGTLCERLASVGLRAGGYHGGMAKRRRLDVQDAFMAGDLDVVVATCAFGMGIDKPDVRFVFHHDAPDSLDSYYQEAGRAGRDGEPAEAVFFYMPQDLGVRRYFAAGALSEDELHEVADAVASHAGVTTLEATEREVHTSNKRVEVALNLLEEVGEIDLLPAHEIAVRPESDAAPDPATAAHAAAKLAAIQEEVEKTRLDMLRGYAEHRECRRRYLLGYFGEAFSAPCGNCDVCRATASESAGPDEGAEPFVVGARVRHRSWGDGRVMGYEAGDLIVVFFESKGYRTLSVPFVRERELLVAAD